MKRISMSGAAVLLCLAIAAPVPAASSSKTAVQMTIAEQYNRADQAVRTAAAAGAATYAPELYAEAQAKLESARTLSDDKSASRREDSRARADEAFYAARAAEAKAIWLGSQAEVKNLQNDITRLGGTRQTFQFDTETTAPIDRGDTSKKRVAFAQKLVDYANSIGAFAAYAPELDQAQTYLKTALKATANDRHSDTADHLAYVAEMLARRAIYLTRSSQFVRALPDLRLERTRRAQAASEAQLATERQQREQAEQQTAQLRQQLQSEAANRQLQADEAARLRQQLDQISQQQQAQLETDRQARVDAERRLDQLMTQYETSVKNAQTAAESEQLRRQVEDQQIALRQMQERERLSEQTANAEIQRLQSELDQQRNARSVNAQALADREAELAKRQQELESMRKAREEDDRARAEAEQRHQQAIAEAQQKLQQVQSEAQQRVQQAQAESEQLRQQMATTQAELAATKQQLAMQQAISRYAQTRTDTRGLIVTLPGLFFDTGKSVLKPGAKNTLGKIADELKTQTGVHVAVEGHTDSVGSDVANQRLSEARANAVRDFLVSRGIPESMITTAGRGESTPVATNETAAGRQQNRRVELIVTQ